MVMFRTLLVEAQRWQDLEAIDLPDAERVVVHGKQPNSVRSTTLETIYPNSIPLG